MSAATFHVNPILLLQTKLYRPQVQPDLVQRSHLIERLAPSQARKLTLVAAPAGYGKTTVVTQWLHTLQTPNQIAWFSLDESDNDLVLFLHYLVTAVQKVQPNSCANTLAALTDLQTLPWAQLATLLLNDLATITAPLILVLDDYHYVTTEIIHQFLDRLLNHLPPVHHLILITRTDPPLSSLPRLRMRQQMNELRTADLSFSTAETKRYLTQDRAGSLTSATISALQERSQGWIAGLYLAKLSLGQTSNEQALLKQLQASNAHIMDYLIIEVLAQQTTAVQTFLLQTSILRRFCHPLCKAVLEETWQEVIGAEEQPIGNSQAPIQRVLNWLDRHHLFVIPLDDSSDWYRYQHFFQLMLTRRLEQQISPDKVKTLHQKASRWFARQGLIDEALHHALAASDTPFAVQLIEQYRMERMNQFDYHTLERWLALLPKEIIKQRPHLILQEYWILLKYMRMTPMTSLQHVEEAEACLANGDLNLDEEETAVLRAEMTAVRASVHFWRGDHQQVLAYYQEAAAALPKSYLNIRCRIILFAAYALQYQGKVAEAIRLMQEGLKSEAAKFNRLFIWFRSYLAPLHYVIGDLHQATLNSETSPRDQRFQAIRAAMFPHQIA
ncbi:MAG: hypothetical protein AAF614_19795, partial [Chloroflexota bacterium]